VKLRYLPVLVVLLVAAPAAADRAVGPIDRLSPWTVELGGAMSYADRSVTPSTGDASATGDDSEVVVAPWMRVWLTDAIEVGLRQPVSGSATGDAELSSSLVVGRGALSGGTSLALVLPTGGWSVSSERLAVHAAALGAWRASRGGHLFARPSYTARAGDYPFEAADAAALEIGFALRARALSLVPRIAAERTLDLGGAIDAFTTWRGGVEAAVELTADLTTSARLDWASASAHRLDRTDLYGRSSEVVATVGLAWAWDLAAAQRSAPSRAPDPAAIRLADARIGEHPATAERLRELRHLVPRLRLATLDAERAAGGARGEMVVRSTGDRVEVDDRVGAPALARAVAEFYRRSLPGWARRADRVEITLCFDGCADAHL
jgi:hypothetical protein